MKLVYLDIKYNNNCEILAVRRLAVFLYKEDTYVYCLIIIFFKVQILKFSFFIVLLDFQFSKMKRFYLSLVFNKYLLYGKIIYQA